SPCHPPARLVAHVLCSLLPSHPPARTAPYTLSLHDALPISRQHLARYAPYQASPFAALNTAFLCDGAFVYVPAGVKFDRPIELQDRKSTRLNSSHGSISYAVFCLKKKRIRK